MVKNLCFLACAIVAQLTSSAAVILYTDFGPGQSICTGPCTQTVSAHSQWVAAPFQPSETAALLSVDIAFRLFNSPDLFTLELRTDASGQPGVILETIAFSVGTVPGSPPVLLNLPSSQHSTLSAGTTYWLVAIGAEDALGGWAINNQGVTGILISGNEGAIWQGISGAVYSPPSLAPAFDT